MLIGQTLRQRYKITQRIDGGGFGDTYLAIDLDLPGKPQCVVKHLSPKNPDPQAMAIAKRLFKTEAEVLSRLGQHPQIPTLYAYFEEEGQFYLVQEFIEGHNLTTELQPGKKWTETKTVAFLQELLEILTLVHQENAVHRDLKPANIMRRERDGKLFLIDFGAVKETVTVDKQGKTNLSVAIGTGAYMPPEQAMGKPGKYSDIYAVGILGIQALTGIAARNLPTDADELKQTIDRLAIDSQLKYVLGRMVSFQYKNRFADATVALQALVPTEIDNPQPQKSNLLKNLSLRAYL